MAYFKGDITMLFRILVFLLFIILCVALYLGAYAYQQGLDFSSMELLSFIDQPGGIILDLYY